jgi:hypothetical protein
VPCVLLRVVVVLRLSVRQGVNAKVPYKRHVVGKAASDRKDDVQALAGSRTLQTLPLTLLTRFSGRYLLHVISQAHKPACIHHLCRQMPAPSQAPAGHAHANADH